MEQLSALHTITSPQNRPGSTHDGVGPATPLSLCSPRQHKKPLPFYRLLPFSTCADSQDGGDAGKLRPQHELWPAALGPKMLFTFLNGLLKSQKNNISEYIYYHTYFTYIICENYMNIKFSCPLAKFLQNTATLTYLHTSYGDFVPELQRRPIDKNI